MALDAAMIIRTASAALFVLLGVAIVVVGRRRWGPVALGAALALTGTSLVVNNVFRVGDGRLFVSVALLVASWIPMAALMVLLPRPLDARERRLLVPAAFVGATFALALASAGPGAFSVLYGIQGSPSWEPLFAATLSVQFGLSTMTLVLFAARAALDPPETPQGWFQYVGLSAVIGVWWLFQTPTLLQEPTSLSSFAAETILVVALSATWLVAAARGTSRIPVVVALVVPAIGLASYAYQLLPAAATAIFFDPWGVLGICRLVGWTILVLAILKADLLGVPLPRVAVHRGAVAATALATLFVVAQVAQNFLSAEYGLLTGGAVAGAFLFAAHPLQRLAERVANAGDRPPARSDAAATDHDEAAYRDAVRLAWKDRRFDRDEEVALANLADRLGLSAKRATEIRHEVEREKGVP